MKTINNVKLFELSLSNPEPIIDEFYLQDTTLLISENPNVPTALMQQNLDLVESLSAYSFALKSAKDTSPIMPPIDSRSYWVNSLTSRWVVKIKTPSVVFSYRSG